MLSRDALADRAEPAVRDCEQDCEQDENAPRIAAHQATEVRLPATYATAATASRHPVSAVDVRYDSTKSAPA